MSYLLLALTAIIAYFFGSVSTVRIASHLVYHKNLRKYPRTNFGITQFSLDHGVGGFAVLLGIECARCLLPVLIGGWLMSILDCADIGRAFAFFCVLLGTAYPIMYHFKGEVTYFALIFGLLGVNYEISVLLIIVFLAVYFFSRYPVLAEAICAVFMYGFSIVIVEVDMVHTLLLFSMLLILLHDAKRLYGIARHTEEKFVYKRDLSYMFDEDQMKRRRAKKRRGK